MCIYSPLTTYESIENSVLGVTYRLQCIAVTLATCSRYLPRETKASNMGGVSKNVFVGEWVKKMVIAIAITLGKGEREEGREVLRERGRKGGRH